MTEKKKSTVERGSMEKEDIDYMIENWDKVTVEEMAEKFGVKPTTVSNAAAKIRKMTGGKACSTKRFKKEDMFKEVLKEKGIDVVE